MENSEVASPADTKNIIDHAERQRPLESRVLKFIRTKKFYTLVALAALIGDTIRVSQPVDPPPRISFNTGTPVPHAKADPDMDIATLMESMETIEDLEEFLKTHVTIESPYFWQFPWTFRQSPDDMQKNEWKGPCNNVVEVHGRWALQHGGKPYLVTICPVGCWSKITNSWHQLIICQTAPDHLVIFNNDAVTDFDGTFDEFLQQNNPGMTLAPWGGLIPWTGTVPNASRAKMLDHFQWNIDEEEFEFRPLPHRGGNKPERPGIII